MKAHTYWKKHEIKEGLAIIFGGQENLFIIFRSKVVQVF